MRVVKPDGVLTFKWSEHDIPATDVWNAIGEKPLFGHHSGKKSNTFWACFMKLTKTPARRMIKIRGVSDDLVEIYDSCYREDEIGCWKKDVRIRFLDGTIIRVGYPKDGKAIWWIEVEKQGTAKQALTICDDVNADVYSDIFEIDSEIKSHSVIKQKYLDRH